jgi:hypothetical protein
MTQVEPDITIALGFVLASYIHDYPSTCSLPMRIAILTNKSFTDPDMDPLVQEVEYWLDLLKKEQRA